MILYTRRSLADDYLAVNFKAGVSKRGDSLLSRVITLSKDAEYDSNITLVDSWTPIPIWSGVSRPVSLLPLAHSH